MFLIYQDYVHNNGNLWRVLSARYGTDNVAFADADAIRSGILNPYVKALFMPGGATRYWAAHLDGEGNDAIRQYVAEGGIYFGICAGAYYACRRTEWQKGNEGEIIVENELDFFKGTARGPISAFKNDTGLCAAVTEIEAHDNETYPCLYWQGPEFIADEDADFQILAQYKHLPSQPPAVVTGVHGQGRYILSSPHLEVDDAKLKLMQFDVVDNRFAELSSLDPACRLDYSYFKKLLQTYIG